MRSEILMVQSARNWHRQRATESQIALVAVVVGLVMMAQYGVLDQALAK
jgi:hypothetical protein